MGKVTGAFIDQARKGPEQRPPQRARRSTFASSSEGCPCSTREQGARCMDCGVPTCHGGCPLGNAIPDWNDLVYRGRDFARRARAARDEQLPRGDGARVPGALRSRVRAEASVEPRDDPLARASRAPTARSTKAGSAAARRAARERRVAVVGSGPAGLACAQQLARAGHDVTVLERDDRLGGLLRYGIPDFKLEKPLIDRASRRCAPRA
jgi:glutamate synthase (NADPH/NADH) small chain